MVDPSSIFAVQVAATKAFGGIESAVLSYGRMFDAVGVSSLCLYRGPGRPMLEEAGNACLDLPRALTGPLRHVPFIAQSTIARLKRAIGDRQALFVIHSDRALPALKRHFPGAWFIAPCHSDKAAGKREADLAATLNGAQQALVSDILAGSRCRAVELGNPFMAKGELARSGDVTRLVFCARFTPVKDPLAIIKAHGALDEAPDLLMLGDGPLMDEARAMARDKVIFKGWCADPWDEITRDDILITPSSWEGLPYMVLEALDRGVPIIASDIAGHCAALDDGAYGALFPLGDHDAMVATIRAALENPAPLRDKALAGQKSLEARFGPHAFWQRLSHELKSVN